MTDYDIVLPFGRLTVRADLTDAAAPIQIVGDDAAIVDSMIRDVCQYASQEDLDHLFGVTR